MKAICEINNEQAHSGQVREKMIRQLVNYIESINKGPKGYYLDKPTFDNVSYDVQRFIIEDTNAINIPYSYFRKEAGEYSFDRNEIVDFLKGEIKTLNKMDTLSLNDLRVFSEDFETRFSAIWNRDN